MRVLKEYRTHAGKISIFSFNEKWIVKCEAGLCEQTYKFPHEEYDLPQVEEICQRPNFHDRLAVRFKDMHSEYDSNFSEPKEKT